MNVTIRLFAGMKETLGTDLVCLDCPAQATVGDVRLRLEQEYPELAALIGHALFAINNDYVADQHPLGNTQELVCIPPVSGG